MKAPSNRILTVLFVALLIFSAVNMYLILEINRTLPTLLDYTKTLQNQHELDVEALNEALSQTYQSLNESDYAHMQAINEFFNCRIDNLNALMPVSQYDYIIYKDAQGTFNAKNGATGHVEFNSTDAATTINKALSNGRSVYVKSDGSEFLLSSDILLDNKVNTRLDSDGAIIRGNGYKIVVAGVDFQHSQSNQISGFRVVNGTLHIENSFRTTVANMIFENSTIGIELVNTNTWTEGTKIDTVHFNKCTQGIVFRTNTTSISGSKSTGSYGNTDLNRCYFNQLDDSIAITVERNVEFTDSKMQNVRIWIAEYGKRNQTGLKLDANSSMYQTLLDGVVFESFAPAENLENAELYAIKIDLTVFQTPNLQAGVSFLGNWTARISNEYANWITGNGSVFKQENIAVPIEIYDYPAAPVVIQLRPQAIASFKPKISVAGSFSQNETVTVRFRLEFIDNSVSASSEKIFIEAKSEWLGDEELLHMFPSENVVWAILVDAKVNSVTSDATVSVSLYGLTT